jgi:hypothetical protein
MTYYFREGTKVAREGWKQFCSRGSRLESWLLEQDYNRVIIVTHSAVMRALFDRYLQGRKADNLGMFIGELVAYEGQPPFWRNIETFKKKAKSANIPSYKNIPSFPKPDELEPPVNFKKGLEKNWCSAHLRLLATPPLRAMVCEHGMWGKSCTKITLGVTIDFQYLVWQKLGEKKIEGLLLRDRGLPQTAEGSKQMVGLKWLDMKNKTDLTIRFYGDVGSQHAVREYLLEVLTKANIFWRYSEDINVDQVNQLPADDKQANELPPNVKFEKAKEANKLGKLCAVEAGPEFELLGYVTTCNGIS